MGYLDLPGNRWVYVYFADGLTLAVENTDTFSAEEAEDVAKDWTESSRGQQHGRVGRVDFQNSRGKILKSWTIDEDGKAKVR